MTRADRRDAIVVTLLRWLFFAVLFALAPILANQIAAMTEGNALSRDELLKDGELFVVSAAVAAAAMGEVISKRMSMLPLRIFVAGASLLVVLATTLWFAHVKSTLRDMETLNQAAVGSWSIGLFIGAAVLGACAMILAEIGRWP